MAFPTGYEVSTTNLSSGSGNPASARADLLTLAQVVNAMTASADQAMGLPILNSSGQINSAQMPHTIAPANTLTLTPSTGFVKINDILRLNLVPRATLLARADCVRGDIALYADDYTGANLGLAVYDGTHWKAWVSISGLTNLS